ncbi:T9SS C-terminal target domain-containing protein [Lewinella cohaerens]|uniref:T9SS C-terminal target domain-containing protein n=1 Tax=Lewinella cohaerens TaxID=70995 RepID=UPI00035FBD5B|nr:T9SS C-terminal target domain-containing protein [Lewinella cohaerens]
MKHLSLIITLPFLFLSLLDAQGLSSVIVEFPEQPEFLIAESSIQYQNAQIGFLSFDFYFSINNPNRNPIFLGKTDSNGTPIAAYRFQVEDDEVGFFEATDYRYKNALHVFQAKRNDQPGETVGNVLIMFNENTNQLWAKTLSPPAGFNLIHGLYADGDNGDILTAREDPEPTDRGFLRLSKLDFFTQTDHWNFKYRTLSNQGINLDYSCIDIEATGNNYHVLASEKLLTVTKGILLKLDQEGNIQTTLRSPELHRFNNIATDPNTGDLYLIGDLNIENTNGVFEDGFLVKLSLNYEVIWAKRIADESASNSRTLDLEVFPNGEIAVLFLASDRGYSFLRFASDGTELEQLTLPLPTSDFAIADNDNLFYVDNDTLRRTPDELVNRPTITRLTQNPTADNCMLTPSCLIIEDVNIAFESVQWFQEVIPSLPDYQISATPIPIVTYPKCISTPLNPSLFTLPDTICIGTEVTPGGLQNHLALEVVWRIIGPQTDTTITAFTFNYEFNISGTFTVRQILSQLGCQESSELSLTVITNNLSLDLGDDLLVCDDDITLRPNTPDNLTYQWSTGANTPYLETSTGDSYQLQISDGYCFTTDTIDISFLKDSLPPPYLTLPFSEAAICPSQLPYALQPASDYSSTFWFQDISAADSILYLPQLGNYTISTQVENCVFTANFSLIAQDCAAPVYLPNVFSPNNDGINDSITPQGKDFTGLRFEIYARWGGLLHVAKAAPFNWDGTSNGQALATGIYLQVFTFINQRTGQEEQLAQEIILLR